MKAQYNYDSAAEGELSLKEDQMLLVFGEEEDGWLLVQEEGGGKVGYVPGNYVEVSSIVPSHLQLFADYGCSLVRSLMLLLLHPLCPFHRFSHRHSRLSSPPYTSCIYRPCRTCPLYCLQGQGRRYQNLGHFRDRQERQEKERHPWHRQWCHIFR
jgi:hypothetical protein